MKKYTKKQILLAAQIGEVSMTDAEHIVSLLDEAVKIEKERKVVECKCIRFVGGDRWYSNGCKIHTESSTIKWQSI